MKVLAIFAIIIPYIASRSVEVESPRCRSNDLMCDVIHERSLEEMTMAPRALNPKGYKVNIVVLYDDAFAKEFGSKAEAEVKKIVAFANSDVGFGHKSLTPKIQLEILATQQAKGKSWTGSAVNSYIKVCEKLAKGNKITDANIYVCLGGKPTGRPGGGVASLATVCDSDRSTRAAYIQYVTMSGDTQKAIPAAKQAKYTGAIVAHELGHSLGMKHDFVGNNENNLKNNPSGTGKCKGVMDYKESTNGWSKCSLADIKKYLNGLKKNCLIPIGTAGRSKFPAGGSSGGGGGGQGPTNPGQGNPPNGNLPPGFPTGMPPMPPFPNFPPWGSPWGYDE